MGEVAPLQNSIGATDTQTAATDMEPVQRTRSRSKSRSDTVSAAKPNAEGAKGRRPLPACNLSLDCKEKLRKAHHCAALLGGCKVSEHCGCCVVMLNWPLVERALGRLRIDPNHDLPQWAARRLGDWFEKSPRCQLPAAGTMCTATGHSVR